MIRGFFADFFVAFIPIFVAMDAVGILPLYVGMVEKERLSARRRILSQAVATAGLIGVLFIFLGKAVFHFLGITVADFKVAGGLILLIMSVNDLLFSKARRRDLSGTIGIVPLGMPLIVGPAVLTTLLMLVDSRGFWPTLAAFALNLVITYLVFRSADPIRRVLGDAGARGVAKVASLLLATIGVMMIRKGIYEIVG